MYLIKFTVIYEESTKVQIPVVHSLTELPPFRVPALLARQEIFLPHKSWIPWHSVLSLSHFKKEGRPTSCFSSFPFLHSVFTTPPYSPCQVGSMVVWKNKVKQNKTKRQHQLWLVYSTHSPQGPTESWFWSLFSGRCFGPTQVSITRDTLQMYTYLPQICSAPGPYSAMTAVT
jgi:hypothetical protein